VYTRDPRLDRLMHAAVYGLVLTMPLSVLYPLSAPLGPDAVALYVTAGLELADIPAIILLLLAAFERRVMRRSGTPSLHRMPALVKLVLALGILALIGDAVAMAPGLAFLTALRWLLAGGVLWAIVQAKVPPQRLAYVLGLGLCVHVVLASLQAWHGGPLGVPGELTLRPGQRSAPVIHLGATRWLRGYGMTFHPNVLGGYLAVALTLLLPLLYQRRARLMSYLLVAGLGATLSRSAALGLMVALPPFVWWLWRAQPDLRPGLRRAATVFVCVALVSLALLWKPIVVRLSPLLVELGVGSGERVAHEERSLTGRREMNALAFELMTRHPFLGIGAGNFPIAMARGMWWMEPQYAHNVPLLLGAEIGVGGLLVWLVMAGWTVHVLARVRASPWMVAAMAAWLLLLTVSLFDCYPWSLNAGRLLTVTVLALLESSAAGRYRPLTGSAREGTT
jgi:hypothetical protein